MKALIVPKDGVWVYGREDLDKRVIPILFNSRDTGIFDLDDCDALSPAKRIVYEHAKSGGVFNPKFVYWAFSCGVMAGFDKRREGEAFRKYAGLFLDEKKKSNRLERVYKDFKKKGVIGGMVFSGVKEFYDSLPPDMERVYFTRNIGLVGEIFAEYLGVDYVYPKVIDKAEALENYIENDVMFSRNLLIKEDFEDDALQMIGVLDYFRGRKSSRVEDYLSVLVSDDSGYCPSDFDFVISRNHKGLVELINGEDS